ncbi:uncharacterized protein V3H82_013430 isoform 1-T1 [Fundulus diaphanus]
MYDIQTGMVSSNIGKPQIKSLQPGAGAGAVHVHVAVEETGPVAAPVLAHVPAARSEVAEREDTQTAAPVPAPAALMVAMAPRVSRNTGVTGPGLVPRLHGKGLALPSITAHVQGATRETRGRSEKDGPRLRGQHLSQGGRPVQSGLQRCCWKRQVSSLCQNSRTWRLW